MSLDGIPRFYEMAEVSRKQRSVAGVAAIATEVRHPARAKQSHSTSRPRRTISVRTAASAVTAIGLAVIALTGCAGTPTTSGATEGVSIHDVKIVDCQNVFASLTVTNTSSERSSYVVTVAFLDASGGLVGQGDATVAGVDPGETSDRAAAIIVVPGDQSMVYQVNTCEPSRVLRMDG